MFRSIYAKAMAVLSMAVGIHSPEYVWFWCGEPGWPRWDLMFAHDGFTFRAVIAPDLKRPSNLGRFVSFAGPDTVCVDGRTFYIPARQPSVVKAELAESGLSASQAERAWRRLLQKEMLQTDDYDRGFWKSYSVVVTIKRGRTELASQTADGIRMDPARLVLGGEQHVTQVVMQLREALVKSALTKLKTMGAQVLHFN